MPAGQGDIGAEAHAGQEAGAVDADNLRFSSLEDTVGKSWSARKIPKLKDGHPYGITVL